MAQQDIKESESDWEPIYDPTVNVKNELWGATSSKITVAENKISYNSTWTGYLWFAYGKDPIHTDKSDCTKISWKFKIHYYSGNIMTFGIVSETKNPDSNAQNLAHLPGNYYVREKNKKTSHNTKGTYVDHNGWQSYGSNHTITMEFDLENKTLSFWNDRGSVGNDVYEGVAFDNIDLDGVEQYYLAVGMSYQGEIITIDECKIANRFPHANAQLVKSGLLFDAAIEKFGKLCDKLNAVKDSIGFEDILKVSENVEEAKKSLKEIEEKHAMLSSIIKKVDAFTAVYCKPDLSKFEDWGVNEIIFWIMSLDNGRFKKHCKQLKIGLDKNQVQGCDLPEISRQDLDVSFKVGVFRDRVLLEKHFQKLGQSNQEGADGMTNVD